MRYILVFQFVNLFYLIGVGQISWPVSPFNQQHAVTGSIGECRESNLHYHMGVDITNGTDFNVYSIHKGVVTRIKYTGNCWTSYIDVADRNGIRIRYFHIKNVSNYIFEGCSVNQGDQIGEMFSLGGCELHVHIEKLNGNFFDSELYPFTDNSLPTIGDLTFCLNGATFYVNRPVLTDLLNINNVNYLILYNKIDIIVDAHDTRLNETGGANGGFLAPFSIEYEIYNINNQSVNNGPTQNYNFSNPPPNRHVQYAFSNGSTKTNFRYILTNDPDPSENEPADKYFNTKLRQNVLEIWPNNSAQDAHYNGNAHYSDGLYGITVRANDVDYGNNPRHNVSSSKQILIDNYRPYIANVKIKEYGSSEYKYSRGWHWIGNQLLFEPEPPNIKFDINKNVNVEVTTSEPMKKVKLQVGSYSAEVNCGTDLNKTTWFFSINKSLLSSGLHTLRFTGEDLAANQLQTNPAVISIRQENGSWAPAPMPGEDTYHKFVYGVSTVDFKATQLGSDVNTIFFNDESSIIGNYFWNFGEWGENPTSTLKDVEHKYNNIGVYNVVHSVNGVSVSKYVSVNELTSPRSKFVYSPLFPDNRNRSTVAEVDFFSTSEGLISTYNWDFGNGETSNEKNPSKIEFELNTTYTVTLTVSNALGSDTYRETLYLDPSTYPFISLFPWELSYFLYDIEIATSNFNTDYPVLYEIEFGDGTSDYYQSEGGSLSYYSFEHQYHTTGEFIIIAKVSGTDIWGGARSVTNAKRIFVSPDELEVNLSINAPNLPPYPLQNVSISANVFPSSSNLWGFWYIYKIGDPLYYKAIGFSFTSNPVLNYQFPSAGIYRVITDINGNGTGHAEIDIEVVNAPDYIDVQLYGRNTISQNSTFTYEAMLWPIGDPGVPDNKWWPTDLRWTLIKPDGQKEIITDKLIGYESQYVQYHQFSFPVSGNYLLRLEAWNDQHGYPADQLKPEYVNTLSFYDYEEIAITVSSQLPALKIITPALPYVDNLSSTGNTDVLIEFTNPGTSAIRWEIYTSDSECVANPFPNMGLDLRSGTIVNLILDVLPNLSTESRFSVITIIGTDNDGNQVQGSPAYLQIYQNGTDGAESEFLNGEESGYAFGYSVSLDGLKTLIGVAASSGKGKAYIYEKNQYGDWIKSATLLPSNNNVNFGKSVKLSGDYAFISGPATNQAYIYKKPLGGWNGTLTEIKLINTNFDDLRGLNVSIWGDYAVIGAPYHNAKGRVQIYYRNEGGTDNWGLTKVIDGQQNDDEFGSSVDIYNDLLAVGAPQGGWRNGYINMYDRNLNYGDSWGLVSSIQPTTSSELPNMKFGNRVSVFNDAVITTFYYAYLTSGGSYSSYIYTPIYKRTNETIFELIGEDSNWLRNEPFSNLFSSLSLFKELRYFAPADLQYSGLYGSEYRYGNMGQIGFCHFKNSHIQPNHYNYVFAWTEIFEYMDFTQGDLIGKSVSQSFSYDIIGIPGYARNNYSGKVLLEKKNKIISNFEAGISFDLCNFRKPAGIYSTINAFKLSLGGNSSPAIIESGAEILYEAGEILLKNGFIANAGSNFTAVALKNAINPVMTPASEDANPEINELLAARLVKAKILKSYQKAFPDFNWKSFHPEHDFKISDSEPNIAVKTKYYQNPRLDDDMKSSNSLENEFIIINVPMHNDKEILQENPM